MGCTDSKTAVGENPRWGTATATMKNRAGGNNGVENTRYKYPASEAFVISLEQPCDGDDDNDETDDGNTNKDNSNTTRIVSATHPLTANRKPPKHIQKLIEQAEAAAAASEQSLKLEHVEKKLIEAEMRRKEYLQQKVDQVQKTTQMMTAILTARKSSNNNNNNNSSNKDKNNIHKDNNNIHKNDDDAVVAHNDETKAKIV